MIFHFFWTILKSKTNSKKANKSSNTKQDILDIDIKRALGIDPKALFSMCIGGLHLLRFSFCHFRTSIFRPFTI